MIDETENIFLLALFPPEVTDINVLIRSTGKESCSLDVFIIMDGETGQAAWII